jgi:hypothetical protein
MSTASMYGRAIFIGPVGNDLNAYTAFTLYFAGAFFPTPIRLCSNFPARPLGGWMFRPTDR